MAKRPHDSDDLSEADLQRLVELDQHQDDVDPSAETKELVNPFLSRAKRGLDFLNQVRESNPHVVDDLAIEANMPTWFEMDGDQPGKIGRHEIISRLGSGGFGVVFLARDPELDRLVALKVPRVETLIHPQTRRRFVRESKTAAQLDHPNIATVYEAGAIGPALYIASQFCPGGSLEDYFEQAGGRISPRDAAEVIASLAEAVEHAHGRGILHRDINPTNILLDVDPEDVDELALTPGRLGDVAKLVDFGLAKNLESGDDETRTGIMLGTPAYTAPELVLEKTDIGPTADVYSLGATLYHALTGSPPHKKDTKFETLLAAQRLEAVPPSRHVPDIPRDLDAICLKSLERDPVDRYQSAEAMAQDLRNHLAGKPVTARRATRIESLVKWSRRNSVVASLLFALAMAGILATGAVLSAWNFYQTQNRASTQLERQLNTYNIRRTFDQGDRELGIATVTPGKELAPRLDISPDGRLAIVAKGGHLHLWDIASANLLSKIPARGDTVTFSGDGTAILFASKKDRIVMSRLATVVRKDAVEITMKAPEELNLGPFDTNELLIGVQAGGESFAYRPASNVVKIANLNSDILLTREFESPIASLALSTNGRSLAVALPEEDRIVVISTQTDQVIAIVNTSRPSYVSFSPNSEFLASSNGKLCSIRKGPEWNGDVLVGPNTHIADVAFSADSRLMATSTAHDELSIKRVSAAGPAAVIAIREDEDVLNMKFSPDGNRFLVLTRKGLVYYWDLAWLDRQLVPFDFKVSLTGTNSTPVDGLPIKFIAPQSDDDQVK